MFLKGVKVPDKKTQKNLLVRDEIEPEISDIPHDDRMIESDHKESQNVIIDDYDSSLTPDVSISRSNISSLSREFRQKDNEITQSNNIEYGRNDESYKVVYVDLNEAEAIANEDILFLNDEDLIEELDINDLIPVDNMTRETGKKNIADSDRIDSKNLDKEIGHAGVSDSSTDGLRIIHQDIAHEQNQNIIDNIETDNFEIIDETQFKSFDETVSIPEPPATVINVIHETEKQGDQTSGKRIVSEESTSTATNDIKETEGEKNLLIENQNEIVKQKTPVFNYSSFESIIPEELKKIGIDDENVYFYDTGQGSIKSLDINFKFSIHCKIPIKIVHIDVCHFIN